MVTKMICNKYSEEEVLDADFGIRNKDAESWVKVSLGDAYIISAPCFERVIRIKPAYPRHLALAEARALRDRVLEKPEFQAYYGIGEFTQESQRKVDQELAVELKNNSTDLDKDDLAALSTLSASQKKAVLSLFSSNAFSKMRERKLQSQRQNAKWIPAREIGERDISNRAVKALKAKGITTVKQLLETADTEIEEMNRIGKKTLQEILAYKERIRTRSK